MSNCVSCGKYAAEGSWICVNCQTRANKSYADLEQDLTATHEEIGRLKAELKKLDMSNAELKAKIEWITAIGNDDDESGSGGLWDLAAHIAVTVALEKRTNENELIYAEKWGQEQIYNTLCDWLKELKGE